MEKQSYNTKSRKYILTFLEQNSDTAVSVGDITEFLGKNNISVNFTTVYRYLNKLVSEQKLNKFLDKSGQKAVYQLNRKEKACHNHIHIQCTECGRLMHLDCEFMDDLECHLEKNHGFNLKCEGSILYGICNECKK